MSIFIETPRLYIREILADDIEGMHEMESDPLVHLYVGDKPKQTIEETKQEIEFIQHLYTTEGICRWAIIEKASDEFVGWTGFKFFRQQINKHTNFHDFGYRLVQRHWGKGLATEAGCAALNYGIDVLGIKEVYAMTDVNNAASRRILEKLGFRFVEIFDYDGEPTWRRPGQPTVWYELLHSSTA